MKEYDFEPIITSEDFKKNQIKYREEQELQRRIKMKEKLLIAIQIIIFMIVAAIVYYLIELI